MFGPDAVNYNMSANAKTYEGLYYGNWSDFAIKQAYVTLRTPVGNGIDWKVGVFDTIIGYEVTDAGNDPNYTRSWGYFIEPTEHTGILATYAIKVSYLFQQAWPTRWALVLMPGTIHPMITMALAAIGIKRSWGR